MLSKDSDSSLQWVAGIYWRDQSVDLLRTRINNYANGDFYGEPNPTVLDLYASEYQTENVALYGQVDYAFNEHWSVVTGLRYENYKADFVDNAGAEFSPGEDNWGGKLALEYRTGNDMLIYGLISRGYKVGGFNPEPNVNVVDRNFDTESMLNYEAGIKSSWFEQQVDLRFAVFLQERDDVQVKQSRADFVEEGSPPTFVEFIANAAEGVNYGVEAEVNWQATDQINIFASVGLLETEYKDFVNASHVDRNQETGEGYDMDGREQAHAPSYQYFAGAQYDFSDAFFARLEFEGKDAFYFSSSHNKQSEDYHLINLLGGYQMGDWLATLWVKNITDETVETRGFFFTNEDGNDPRKFYAPETYTQKGAPRTFGVTLAYEF